MERKRVKRTNASKINPDWTEEEVSILVDVWRDLETNPDVQRVHNRKYIAGGLDTQIALQFAQVSPTSRSAEAIKGMRCRINQVIRIIRTFDQEQRAKRGPSGGRLYFDLTKEERKQVRMNQRERATSRLISQESFNKLMRLESVQKYTSPGKTKRDSKARAEPSNHRPLKRRVYWSDAEVSDLVHVWAQVMKRKKISVTNFAKIRCDELAELYTPQDRSPTSTWQKMKSIVVSYEFIKAFNEHHGPDQWFSGSAQDLRIDWGELPTDFEDIGREIFDEINGVDRALVSSSISTSRAIPNMTSLMRPPSDDEVQDISEDQTVDDNVDLDSSQLQDAVDQCSAEFLHNESPHAGRVNASANQVRTHPRERNHQNDKINRQGLKTLQERMMQLQNEQFQQAVDRLRVDVERDLERSTEMVTTILFDRFGEPGTDGDATFVSKLLEGHRLRVEDHFARFQEEVSRNLSRKDYSRKF